MKITLKDLKAELAKDVNITSSKANIYINFYFQEIKKHLLDSKRIQLKGFGSFKCRKRKKYLYTSNLSQKTILLQPRLSVVWRASRELKEKVNKL